MKKRNKKWAKEKEFKRLKEKLHVNRRAQRDLGWVDLEKPIFNGWNAVLDLRSDIKNREDSWVFEWIAKNLTYSVYFKRIEDFPWNKRSFSGEYLIPHIRFISEEIYNNLHPQIKKYFTLDTYGFRFKGTKKYADYKYRFGDWYICTVPDFYFEIKYTKSYKTRVRLIDEILLQEEDDIEKEIYAYYFDEFYYYKSAPRHFRNHLNRIQRQRSKKDIIREINGEDPKYTPNYKNAKWLWW